MSSTGWLEERRLLRKGVATPIYTILASATAVKMAVNEILVPVNGQNEYFTVINSPIGSVKIIKLVHVARKSDNSMQ